jgi:hypothetical protein
MACIHTTQLCVFSSSDGGANHDNDYVSQSFTQETDAMGYSYKFRNLLQGVASIIVGLAEQV